MARSKDSSFAPPVSTLATPSLAPPGVTAGPSAGQGLSLNEKAVVSANASPDREIAYVEFDTNKSITATTEAGANEVVTSGEKDYDGSAICIRFYSPRITAGVAALRIACWDASTNHGLIASLAAGEVHSGTWTRVLVPDPGTRRFRIAAWNSAAATSTIGAGAGGAGATLMPGFLWITGVVRG